jgi:hypothetical protein
MHQVDPHPRRRKTESRTALLNHEWGSLPDRHGHHSHHHYHHHLNYHYHYQWQLYYGMGGSCVMTDGSRLVRVCAVPKAPRITSCHVPLSVQYDNVGGCDWRPQCVYFVDIFECTYGRRIGPRGIHTATTTTTC